MKIGKFQIDLIHTGNLALDGGAMFGVVPKALWGKAYSKGDDLNRIPMTAKALLIRYEDKNILVDAGSGNKLDEKFKKIYAIDYAENSLEKSLNEVGVAPDEITDFIYTHLHFDHAGGSTKYEKDQVIPVFHNAKHYVQKEQFEWALKPSEKDRASFIADNYLPIRQEGMLELLEGRGEIFPGIELLPVYGHTKAMQMIKVTDGGKTILYPTDLSPTFAHVKLPFVMGYDNEPLRTIEEKKQYLYEAAEEGWIVIFEHDAFCDGALLEIGERGLAVKKQLNF